jgi:hypothetical protein
MISIGMPVSFSMDFSTTLYFNAKLSMAQTNKMTFVVRSGLSGFLTETGLLRSYRGNEETPVIGMTIERKGGALSAISASSS